MAGIFLNGKLYGTDAPIGGIQILSWSSGNTYYVDNLVLYLYDLYQCLEDNSDATFDDSKWKKIGAYDGDYAIINDMTALPLNLKSTDRKLYYSITDLSFFLWNGTTWIKQQKKATYNDLGSIIVDEETLNIDENGKLSIRVITDSQVNTLF